MAESSQWEVLEACPLADETDWGRHVAGFVAAFVVPAKRDRWVELLTRRPRRVGANSHKLLGDLDKRRCQCVGEEAPAGLRGAGLLYRFDHDPRGGPRVVPAESAALAAGSGDALFLLAPGRLAVYFFHEGTVWVCQA